MGDHILVLLSIEAFGINGLSLEVPEHSVSNTSIHLASQRVTGYVVSCSTTCCDPYWSST